ARRLAVLRAATALAVGLLRGGPRLRALRGCFGTEKERGLRLTLKERHELANDRRRHALRDAPGELRRIGFLRKLIPANQRVILADLLRQLVRRGAHVGEAGLELRDIARVVEDLLPRVAREEVDELRLLDKRKEGLLVASRERHGEKA